MNRLARVGRLLFVASFGAAALTMGLSGCGKKDDDPNTFTNVYASFTSSNCVQCHTTPDSTGTGLDFSTQASAFQGLTTRTVTGPVAVGTCSNVRLVAASSPATSYLPAILIASYQSGDAGKTGCVPVNTHLQYANFTADEESHLIGWIQAGAQNN